MKVHQKNFWVVLGAITILALAIRLLAGYQMYNSVPGVQEPISATDMHTYIKYAKQFKDGTYTEFDGAYYYQPFYSAVFLRSIFTLFGDSIFAMVVCQAVLGALTVLLTGLIGGLLAGRNIGAGAAIIMAVFRNHILYTPYALMAILQTFLITLTVYLLILGFKKGYNKYWIFAGLTTACSILCRGNFLLILPLILGMVFWKYRLEKKQALIKCALFLFMVYLPQMPFSIKNYQITGKWTGPSIAGGVVLAIGNNPDGAPGTLDMESSHYFHYDGGDEYSHWSSIKAEKPFNDSIKEWILDYPLQWIDLKLQALMLYLSNEECYNNITLYQNAQHVPWLYSPILLDYWIVGIPFLVFIFKGLYNYRKQKSFLLIWVSLIYIASTVLFYVLSRYKLPIIPLMSVIAVYEFRRWYLTFKAKDSKLKVALAISIVSAVYAVVRLFHFYQESFEAPINQLARPEGNQFETVKAWHVKDHNNSLRGDWNGQLLEQGDVLTKKFSPIEGFGKGKGILRFYAVTDSQNPVPVEAIVEHDGKVYRKKQLFNSRWLEVPIENVDPEKEFKIRLVSNIPAAIFYTPQRNFGRSLLNDKVIRGEWIVQLKVFKEK